MPTYEYACTECGLEFEVFQSMKDAPLKTCNCGKNGKVNRKIGRGAGLIFKGSGFYETDYKRTAETKKAEKNDATSSVTSTTATPAGNASAAPAAAPATAKTEAPAKKSAPETKSS